MFSKRRIAVLGAGPAGLTAAYQLSKDPRFEVTVFEASEQVGGLAKSIDLWGQTVDLGPHRFHSHDKKVLNLYSEILGDRYAEVKGCTRIYFENKFFDLPLKPLNVIKNLGPINVLKCGFSFLKSLLFQRNTHDTSLGFWMTKRFGKRLYELFFKAYNEKLWGLADEQLDAEFAVQRLRGLSLWGVLKLAFKHEFRDYGKNFVQSFSHPLKGSGEFYENMTRKIIQSGSVVHLSRPIKGLWTDGHKNTLGIELVDGEFLGFDHVISSIPLTKLLSGIKEAPADVREAALTLKFRNTVLVYLEVEGSDLFPDQWIYINDSSFKMGRLTNFRNWSPKMCGESRNSILAIEFWCGDKDELWQMGDASLLELAQQELLKIDLVKNIRILNSDILRIPRCYPVYEKGYKDKLRLVENYLDSVTGVQAIGRYGSFKYNNQDHSILMGILAAENLLEDKKHNLWNLHCDYMVKQASKVA